MFSLKGGRMLFCLSALFVRRACKFNILKGCFIFLKKKQHLTFWVWQVSIQTGLAAQVSAHPCSLGCRRADVLHWSQRGLREPEQPRQPEAFSPPCICPSHDPATCVLLNCGRMGHSTARNKSSALVRSRWLATTLLLAGGKLVYFQASSSQCWFSSVFPQPFIYFFFSSLW